MSMRGSKGKLKDMSSCPLITLAFWLVSGCFGV